MESKAKKLSTRICVGLFFFLGGIEYAVILPTLWLYVEHRFDAEQWFFGVIFSSFCFSSLFSSPFFGFWVDYTRTTKKAILFANLFEIGGNFLYFVAWSKYWVLAARLMAGIGAGVGSAIFAQIARTTTVEERTGMYSLAMGLRQFGLLLGPSFNLFLKELNVKLGPFLIDAYTSPGIFMAVTWLLLEIVIILFYHDWSLVEASSYKEEKSSSPRNAITSCESKEMSVDSQINPCVNVADEDLTVLSNGRTICQDSTWKLQDVNLPLRRLTLSSTAVKAKWNLAKDLMREEVMVILASQFILFFNETAFEALFTPLSEHLLGWKEVQNSIAYSLIALEAILVFFLVSKLSHRMSDRWLIVVGTAFEGFALIWYLCLLANAKPYEPVILPTIIVGTLVIVFGIPFFSVANVSLYSKITEERTQGIAQGVQRSTTGVAMILGPLWGGSLIPSLYLMFGVMLAIEVIFAIMLFMSFDLLKESPRELPSQYDEISTHDENQPLLA